jgi:hypothetical protein
MKMHPFWWFVNKNKITNLLCNDYQEVSSEGWEKIGLPPYLSLQDYPLNWIRGKYAGANISWFLFQDLPTNAISITSIELKFLARMDTSISYLWIFTHNGIDGATSYMSLSGPVGEWYLQSFDITFRFDTVAKVNAAKIGFDLGSYFGDYLNIDLAYLAVKYKIS